MKQGWVNSLGRAVQLVSSRARVWTLAPGSRVQYALPPLLWQRVWSVQLLSHVSATVTTSRLTLSKKMEDKSSTIKILENNSFSCYYLHSLIARLLSMAFPDTPPLVKSPHYTLAEHPRLPSIAFFTMYYYTFIEIFLTLLCVGPGIIGTSSKNTV